MFISIDVETSGVDPQQHQILEIAAVAWDHEDINECSFFRATVDPRFGRQEGRYGSGNIVGEPRALIMNQRLLKDIGEGNGFASKEISQQFRNWATWETPLNAVGLNYGGFDHQFLKFFPDWPLELFGYRFTEVGSLFVTNEGPVSGTAAMSDAAERHGIEGRPHEALFDAKCALAILMDHLADKSVTETVDERKLSNKTFASDPSTLTTYQLVNNIYGQSGR